MSVDSTLMARQKDGKRSGFLKTDGKPLSDLLKPLQCAILSVPPQKGFTLPAMIEILLQWNLFKHIRSKKDYNHYKLLKDVLRNPRRQGLSQQEKLRGGPFLKNSSTHITHLQTRAKARQDAWNIFELMELQEVFVDSQLLLVEVKPSDH